jgi:2-polyprenyl-6-methoxyphenol hydroxylase-like FAD-dependent oxidoreductase
VLDKLLVDAAAAAGVEVREGVTVDALLWDAERVTGVRGHSRRGLTVEERARVVIGADGGHSVVAKGVRAEEYDALPPRTSFYYSYYSGFAAEDIEQYVRDHSGAACFPTHDGLTLIGAVWPSAKFPEVRSDIEGHVSQVHASAPSVADRMRSARREARWVGTAGVANFFRRPYGSGWALVGDAGYQKDPLTAQGITDAFTDAEQLANALDDGFTGRRTMHDALAEYHTSRDHRVKAMYDFTCELAKLEPPPPPMQQLFSALHGNREATGEYYAAFTGAVPLSVFMNPENIGRIVQQAG